MKKPRAATRLGRSRRYRHLGVRIPEPTFIGLSRVAREHNESVSATARRYLVAGILAELPRRSPMEKESNP
jgi:hypothetical protein